MQLKKKAPDNIKSRGASSVSAILGGVPEIADFVSANVVAGYSAQVTCLHIAKIYLSPFYWNSVTEFVLMHMFWTVEERGVMQCSRQALCKYHNRSLKVHA